MARTMVTAFFALAIPLLAQEPQAKPDAKTEYKQLVEKTDAAMKEWQAALRKQVAEAKKSGGAQPAISMEPPIQQFVAKAQEHAKQYAGTEDAVPFLLFLTMRGGSDRAVLQDAAKTLVEGHAGSPQIAQFVQFLPRMGERALGGDAAVRAAFDRVLAANKDAKVLAAAHYARGGMMLQHATSDEERAAGKADLVKAAELGDARMKAEAEGTIFEMENLQVGCTAPEIEGKDTDDVPFKLSDYRGKVVMLDFWGFW